MLAALGIRDFVIVEHLQLEFADGFTALTGETGAGKSILIDALQFVLGERTAADTVREGAARAEVAAQFTGGADLAAWLEAAGLPVEADGATGTTVLVRRTLDAAGRSRGFINGSAATGAQLREIGALLLDIHGQHEHQLLMRAAAQQQLLDRHGRLGEALQQVGRAHALWVQARQSLERARDAQAADALQAQRLQDVVEDLGALGPQDGEWERVESEQRRLSHGAALLEGTRQALDELAESDGALQGRLARLGGRLQALLGFDARLAEAVAAVEGAQAQVDEAARALQHYLSGTELDEARLAEVEARVAALHAAGRKWRCAPAGLPQLLLDARERLAQLEKSADLERLQKDCAVREGEYLTAARALSRAREQAAARMGEAVTAAMQDLAMQGGRLEIRLQPCEPSATGLEKVEFLVSAHPGGSARPLARVASGGELSRIGLAIAVVAAQANPVPTLIFDEVDAGIGGQVAATIGRRLGELGVARQVFCVTHLPQVASCARQHLAVRKGSDAAGAPRSSTETLEGEARVQEIARMLGGAQVTPVTLRHARELLRAG